MADALKAGGYLEITVKESGMEPLYVEAPDVQGCIFGRIEDKGGFQPDIDLGPYNARTKGVSRRHAVLLRSQGRIVVLDLDSANGTFVNGVRVSGEEAMYLQNGDEVRLGYLTLTIRAASS